MPKALAKAKLSAVTPTEQELADARAHLQSMTPQQLNAKKASIRQFLVKNPDTAVTPGSLLGKVHVHAIRSRDTEKIWASTRDVKIEKTTLQDVESVQRGAVGCYVWYSPVFASLFCVLKNSRSIY